MPAEAAGAGPDGYDAFLEFSEDAFFLEVAEGGIWFCVRGEGAKGGLGRGTSVYGSFGGDEVVGDQRDRRLRLREHKANLLGDEVAG